MPFISLISWDYKSEMNSILFILDMYNIIVILHITFNLFCNSFEILPLFVLHTDTRRRRNLLVEIKWRGKGLVMEVLMPNNRQTFCPATVVLSCLTRILLHGYIFFFTFTFTVRFCTMSNGVAIWFMTASIRDFLASLC